jgi:hypothetical protein
MSNKKVIIPIGETIEFAVYDYTSDEGLCPIAKLFDYVTQAVANGATHVRFGGTPSWGGEDGIDDCYISALKVRVETTAEFENRVKEDKNYTQRKKAQEKREDEAELKRLQKKLGK